MPSCQSVKPISGNSTCRIDLDATARQPSGQAYTGLDRALTEQIRALIARLQALDLVRADIDGSALGELVFNNMNMMFIEFVKRDEARIPDLRAAIRRQNRILVAAIGV